MYKNFVLYFLALLILGCTASPETQSSPKIQSKSLNNASLNQQKLQPVALQLTTHLGDQQAFVAGDEIQFLLSLDRSAFIYMYYIDADNHISQILPNQNHQNNYYSAGYYQAVPASDIPYRFTINKPFGKETIWVIASDQSIRLETTYNSIGNLKQINASIDAIKAKIKQQSREVYGNYALKITTREK